MKRLRVLKMAALVLTTIAGPIWSSGLACGEAPGTPLPDWKTRLRKAIAQAAAHNPELTSMEARIEAARRRVSQSAVPPDPELELGLKDVPVKSPSLTRDDFTMEMVSAKQSIPASGKLATRKRAAEAELDALESEHARHVAAIAADVADSFFALASIDSRISIVETSRQRLSEATVSARERYRVGKGAQADVLRADLEKTALDDQLANLRAERRSQVARFNTLQFLPAGTTVAPATIEPAATFGGAPGLSEDDLVRKASEESPAVAVAQAQLRGAAERLELARLERRPDWMLTGYYARRERFEDLGGVSASFNLPWAHPRRLSERRAEAEADVSAARASLSSVRNDLSREIEMAYAELEKNREQAQLYRDSILPQAEINYRAAREAYAVGSIDFLTYVRAATDLDTYQAESVERETGIGRALAMLQKASGLPLIEGTPVPGEKHVEK
jgi:outer membrane protein TolC